MISASPHDLATRQLWRTFWGGLALTPLLCLGLALLVAGAKPRLPASIYEAAALTGSVWLLAALPALAFGWMRLGAMRWLCSYYLARPTAGRRAGVVLGTLVLFEATVLAGTLGLYGWERGRVELLIWWRACTGFSLPWLLAALWASWRVLRPVGLAQSVK